MNGISLSDPVNRQEVDTGGEGKKEKGGVLSSALPGNTREKQGCLCKFVNGHIPPARPRPACADMDPTTPAPEFCVHVRCLCRQGSLQKEPRSHSQ